MKLKEEDKIIFTKNEVKECFEFAHDMKGKHKPNISRPRKQDWLIFVDDFRGKLGEFATKKYLEKYEKYKNISKIDTTASPRGVWDESDLEVDKKILNVKAVKGNSSFIMLETSRYKQNGEFTYDNNNGKKTKVDYYVLVRVYINPELEEQDFYLNFEDFRKKYSNNIYAEVLGGISHEEFWKEKAKARSGIKCVFKNLNYIVKKKEYDVNKLPVKPTGREKPDSDSILQVDNYIVSKDQLYKLEDIL